MVGLQQPAGLGRCGAGVLDGLRLIKNDIVKAPGSQSGDVATQRTIRGNRQVGLHRIEILYRPIGVAEIMHHQLRREACRLTDPVEHERARHDQQR